MVALGGTVGTGPKLVGLIGTNGPMTRWPVPVPPVRISAIRDSALPGRPVHPVECTHGFSLPRCQTLHARTSRSSHPSSPREGYTLLCLRTYSPDESAPR